MSHLHRILLLATLPLLALPACGTADDDDAWAFRTSVHPPTTGSDDWGNPGLDECILINEPPSSGGGDDGNDPPDPEIDAPTSGGSSSSGGGTACTDPAGCIDPPPPQTWPDDGGGVFTVPSSCPEWQTTPLVGASTEERAIALCLSQFGDLCDSVCECHGGEQNSTASSATCVSTQGPSGASVPSGFWHCGCECILPES